MVKVTFILCAYILLKHADLQIRNDFFVIYEVGFDSSSTLCLSFCQEWVWVKGGWSDLWGVGSDCYAELIQSSEHLCSQLIFKSMQHCKRITIPESQYPLMRHFYSCDSRLKSLFVPSLWEQGILRMSSSCESC